MTWKDNVLNTKIDDPSSDDYRMDDEMPDDFQDDSGPSLLKQNQRPIILAIIGVIALGLIVGFFFLKKQRTAANEKVKYISLASDDMSAFSGTYEESDITDRTGSPSQMRAGNESAAETEMRLRKIEGALAVMKDIKNQLQQLAALQKQIDELSGKIGGLDKSMSSRTADMAAKINQLKNSQSKLADQGQPKPIPAKTAPPKAEKKPQAEKKAPQAVYHTIQPKETLFSISQKYKINIDQLRKQNNLTGQTTIYIGTKLLITPGR